MSSLSMAAKLSEHELSILRLISYGQSNAEAAAI
jgi:DNA-binding CsgD family transcriptional regulator